MKQFYQLIQLFTRNSLYTSYSQELGKRQYIPASTTNPNWFAKSHSVFIIIFIILLFCNTVSAAKIISVQSLSIKPYNDAVKGFQSACNCSVEQFIISEMYEADINKRIQITNPELIIAVGSKALEIVKEIKDISIISLMVLNPQSIISDHDNISGIDLFIPPKKQLAEITRLIPHLKTIGLIYDPARTGNYIKDIENASIASNIRIIAKQANDPLELPSLLNSMKDEIDAFWMIPDLTVVNQDTIEILSLFAIKYNLPLISFSKSYFKMGALISLDIDSIDIGRQAWEIAEQILSGKNSNQIKTSYARTLISSINHKTVKNFGMITINNMLIRAIATKSK